MSETLIGIGILLVSILFILQVGMWHMCDQFKTIRKLIEKALMEKENG